MARTLYMKDGSRELVIGDKKECLQKIIREYLGTDCEALFEEIIAPGEEALTEAITSTKYRVSLQTTLDEVNWVLALSDSPRIAFNRLRRLADMLCEIV